MYVTITCMRLKHALHCIIVATGNCTGQWHCQSTPKDGLPTPRGLANEILFCAIEQADQEVQQEYHNLQHVSNQALNAQLVGNFRIFQFCVYLISYTRLFTKLHLFKILLYNTFITIQISRSTVCSRTC